ncbi:unnamed protein product [Paramecium sonneborni]|uniref:Uncharacterized protein n=1 Tax=Paramecium sonneborni TaxID=65129 RepID=A0A8S1R925_9CILI|nr:unnamed protein product [Paramecium sonneborni]
MLLLFCFQQRLLICCSWMLKINNYILIQIKNLIINSSIRSTQRFCTYIKFYEKIQLFDIWRLRQNIIIWSINNNNQWVCSQTIQEHNNRINCLIINNNEDLFISGSDDKTIKFWIKKNQWICLQTITDHQSEVYSLSLNEQQNQVISCGVDNLILIIEYSELNRNWIVIQKINVDCYGIRLCFIDDNLFTFKPYNGNLMYVYEKNSVSKQFTKTKDIIVNQGNDYNILFPQQYIKQKQLLVNRHNEYVNFIRKRENGEFKLEQSIEFNTNLIFGSLSDDGDYFITWDESSKEIQIRKYTEE